ncbi:MAG: RHS repeat-associated core domain-containing protein [Lewinellaceae bacterium]|nr:RHS repeat-associated core domain-containing protein [Lewinellaceae bacterium]
MAMSLTYDATGRKWKKDGEFGAVLYDSGIEYRDGVLEAIYAPDGRLVAEYPSGGNRSEGDISRFVAEYWHQDHLGNTRLAFADFNEDSFIEIKDNPSTGENELEITQEAHYYPFGMGHFGPWYATVAPENKYLYNGKELNEDYGINLMDYGARWYDGALGRYTTIDRFAEKYNSYSPYSYAANNPIKFIDVNGDSLNVSDLMTKNSAANDKLINSLEYVTGFDLEVNKTGNVSISGRLRDADGKKVKGSRLARKSLKKLINSSTTISVVDNQGGGTKVVNHENKIRYDQGQQDFLQIYLSQDLHKEAFGPGITFFHELGHTAYGGGLADPGGEEAKITSGEIEIIPNKIRRQLGPSYGQRKAYDHTIINTEFGPSKYLPFSKQALRQIQEGKPPTSSYHGPL